MSRQLTIIIVLGAIASVACSSGAVRAADAKVNEFQERADAGRLDDIRRDYTPGQSDWEKYMQQRRQLGRLQRTSRVWVEDVGMAHYHMVSLAYNSEFEHAHAVENFVFKIEDSGPRLLTYNYVVGRKRECYLIGGCEEVTLAPKSASHAQ